MELINKIVEQQIKAVNDYKEKIVRQSLLEKDIEIDLDRLKNQRFKRLIVEIKGDDEYWYYDNGTDDGQLIVVITSKQSESGFGTVIKYRKP